MKATFGAGCFWGVEAAFQHVKGVTSTVVGYGGGTVENPTYEQVCTGKTGHAEVVQIEFDPATISYTDLLKIFFTIHDPTMVDQQGLDMGHQYRSVIFFHTPEQELEARQMIYRIKKPIVTDVAPAGPFYRAEEYHQHYHDKHGGSCDLS